MSSPIVAPRKLIEVALPLDNINRASAREKAMRHGHPSTLHLWWARRPLAAARAVLFAQLVNDPSWKYSEDELKRPAVRAVVSRKRNELFRLLSELVKWENTNNQDVVTKVRAVILESWRETCDANKGNPDQRIRDMFDRQVLPPFHDPFAGGGSLPLEAQRLGLRSYASDLNPVAVIINKAMIEIPPRFAGRKPVGPKSDDPQTTVGEADTWAGCEGLAEDVARYGRWVRSEAFARIGHLYPNVQISKAITKIRPELTKYEGRELTPIAWIWTRVLTCPNPACGVELPLVKSFALSTKRGEGAYATAEYSKGGDLTFKVRVGKGSVPAGTIGKAGATCIRCAAVVPFASLREAGRAGGLRQRLMAIVTDGDRGRVYLSPEPTIEKLGLVDGPTQIAGTALPEKALGFRIQEYGMRKHRDLFTGRQLTILATLRDAVRAVRDVATTDARNSGWAAGARLAAGGDGAVAYGEAISTYLAFLIDQVANHSSSLCGWNAVNDQMRSLFSRNAISMVWDFAESNPFSDSSGSFNNLFERMIKAFEGLPRLAPPGHAVQADAAQLPPDFTAIYSLDPPYYDNVGYADMSDVFYVWMRLAIGDVFPEEMGTVLVPKEDEMIANPFRHGGPTGAQQFFNVRMRDALSCIRARSHPAFPITIYYAFKQTEGGGDDDDGDGSTGVSSTGWDTFLTAAIDAGLEIVGTWPLRTEKPGRMRDVGSNALAGSIALVCRPRAANASSIARREFMRELDRVLPTALSEMTADASASIAPVDLQQAAIGPGMAVFSRHKCVLEADGTTMTVHHALVHINKAIDDYFAHAEGDLDGDTRFCVTWFQQYGFEPGAFGEADVLARAKGTSVDGVQQAGVVHSAKGKVRLLKLKEYPRAWDPTTDDRTPIWEASHQMCRALAESEHAAGVLLARMPDKQDAIRQLAYRLYTLCERKGWAEEARAYNDLITSWPAIVEEGRKAGHKDEQLDLMS